jgi:hypothetical protein
MRFTLMLHKSYQTGMLPNLSNAALLGILWVTRFFTKSDLCNMLGIPVFNVGRWPLESFSSISVCWIIWFFLQH